MQQPFRRAHVYITLLLITEALIGVFILAATGYYHKLLTGYLSGIECRLVYGYLFGVYMFGAQLAVIFLCSILMWRRLWKRRCTPNIRLLLDVWLFYSCVIIAAGFGCVWIIYRGVDVLENAAETALARGIDMYYSSPEWKLLWDGLQWDKECCGVHTYRDWANADWMPRRDANSSFSILAPYTCCKRSCENCFNYVPGKGHTFVTGRQKQLTVDSINMNGCLPVFGRAVWSYLYILLGFWVLALKFLVSISQSNRITCNYGIYFFFKITLCCLTKYILTRQNMGDGCYNSGLTDDDGYPLVVVKYPPNVRCVTISEEDLASDNGPDVKYCNCSEMDDEQCGY
ncbi:hypothetical protein KR200_002554 [Drosophila serrata]|nr:hypothetical protein KR200_002554 [Drosophila serrata]